MKNLKNILSIIILLISFISFGQEIPTEDLKPNKDIKYERLLKGRVYGVNNLKSSDLILKPPYYADGDKRFDTTQPLFIVDGIVFDNGSENGIFTQGKTSTSSRFLDLEPNNIDSISILKGEEAIEKYGEEGKNGVILVTTKEPDLEFIQTQKDLIEEQKRDNSDKKIINLSGLIIDCEGIPIADVEIKNLNAKKNYKTDEFGKYSISVNKNDYLVFKKEGFYSQKIKIIRQKTVDIKLKMIPVLTEIPNSNGNIIIKKPIIYLYPTEKTDITLQIDYKGKLLTTFPKYDKNWQVTAYPNGKIFDKKSNRFYSSLFWDGEINFPNEHYDYKSGFEVSKNNLTSFLIENLEFLGLNNFETNEFIQYWLPILEKNETNFIHFRVNEDYNSISKNIVNPKPETEIRVFMEFYNLEYKTNLPEQILEKSTRKGFTLIELGGADVSNIKN